MKIKAEAVDVYAALTNPFTIELWSGYPAVMSDVPGTEFSLWEGDIEGRVIESVPDAKLVQEWYFGDQPEKSIATIKIFPDGAGKVQVELVHANIPDEAYDEIAEGWKEYYLDAIKEFLEIE
ncbi:MAG: SRPBCC domain-containing protein [Breznakibacter sp.]